MKKLLKATFKGNKENVVDVRLQFSLGSRGGRLYLQFMTGQSIKAINELEIHLPDDHVYKLVFGKIVKASDDLKTYVVDVVDISPMRNLDIEGYYNLV